MDKVLCFCGCGQEFEPLDKYGRPRKYMKGHNRKGTTMNVNRGPENPMFGKSGSDKNRETVASIWKGKNIPDGIKSKMVLAKKEKVFSAHHIIKLRTAHRHEMILYPS